MNHVAVRYGYVQSVVGNIRKVTRVIEPSGRFAELIELNEYGDIHGFLGFFFSSSFFLFSDVFC